MAEEIDGEQLNRQIIYTIIKMLWRRRADKLPLDGFYGRKEHPQMPMNERTYGEVLRGGSISDAVSVKLDSLADLLHIDRKYLSGKRNLTIPGLPIDKWAEYFNQLDNCRGADKTAKAARKTVEDFQQDLSDKLSMIPRVVALNELPDGGYTLTQLYGYYVYSVVLDPEKLNIVERAYSILKGLSKEALVAADRETLTALATIMSKQLPLIKELSNA